MTQPILHIHTLVLTLTCLVCVASCQDNVVYSDTPYQEGTYNSTRALLRDKLGADVYDTSVLPVVNQSDVLVVNVTFSLINILEVDDVAQRFRVSGFTTFRWVDEIFRWNPDDYEGLSELSVHPDKIWTPSFIVINTVNDETPFRLSDNHLVVESTGLVLWVPREIFTTSCKLDMNTFPFDVQQCKVQLLPIHYYVRSLVFRSIGGVDKSFFIPNEGWELLQATVAVDLATTGASTNKQFSAPVFTFTVKRRPGHFLLGIILPVIVLSLLNNFVFIIPDNSGEKISYGTTVLITMALFMNTVSDMTPSATRAQPSITIYLFSLLICSVTSVLATIVITYLHFREMDHQEAVGDGDFPCSKRSVGDGDFPCSKRSVGDGDFPSSKRSVGNGDFPCSKRSVGNGDFPCSKRSVGNGDFPCSKRSVGDGDFPCSKRSKDTTKGPIYLFLIRHMNQICFVFFMSAWLLFTFVYFLKVFYFYDDEVYDRP